VNINGIIIEIKHYHSILWKSEIRVILLSHHAKRRHYDALQLKLRAPRGQ